MGSKQPLVLRGLKWKAASARIRHHRPRCDPAAQQSEEPDDLPPKLTLMEPNATARQFVLVAGRNIKNNRPNLLHPKI